MNIVLDTNVLLSGIFFGGLPQQILEACLDERIGVVATPEVLAEYQRSASELSATYPLPDLPKLIHRFTVRILIVAPVALHQQVCRDPDDDKFIACALAANAQCIVSGDKDLLVVQHPAITVLSPRQFANRYPEAVARS